MIFRQLFDDVSCTYTYLLAGGPGGEAVIIDPVEDKTDRYLRLLEKLDVRLVKALDTHVHADHVSGLRRLRDETRCITVMGRESMVDVVSMRVGDGEAIEIGGVRLTALHTPGHTDDSYCFLMDDRVFTGDTLLIRGTGRTDFQNGDSRAAYASITEKLLTLPDPTLVYPGHDYKGDTVSTIGEERRFNPRLQVASAEEYAAIMDGLDLADPKMMDVAVPANLAIGLEQGAPELAALSLDAADARSRVDDPSVPFVDLREAGERRRDGVIPGSIHLPYGSLGEALKAGSPFRALIDRAGTEVVFYCAYGERSALALESAREAGLANVRHLAGGLDAWARAGGPREPALD